MIDSHCHLADDAFVDDLEEVTDRAKAAGLKSALCILDSTNPVEATRFRRVVEAWPSVRCATGVHPHQAGQYRDREDDVQSAVARAIAELPQACAVGEIGLDYHYDFAPRELQQEVFRRQVRLAREQALPVVIHTREADADTVAILLCGGCRPGAAGVGSRVLCVLFRDRHLPAGRGNPGGGETGPG